MTPTQFHYYYLDPKLFNGFPIDIKSVKVIRGLIKKIVVTFPSRRANKLIDNVFANDFHIRVNICFLYLFPSNLITVIVTYLIITVYYYKHSSSYCELAIINFSISK